VEKMTTKLRKLLNEDGIIVQPGAHDAISARLAELAGFKMVGFGGTAMGIHLGVGEPRLTINDVAYLCRYTTSLINIPLRVDAGPGYGDPVQVVRTIRELEAAGVACVHLEDGVFPHRATHAIGVDPIIDADEMVEKIKAAAAARKDPDFIIVGRSDAVPLLGLDEGIKRANMYLEAGADVAYIFPQSIEEARIAAKEINGPCIINNSEAGHMPHLSIHEAEDMGYKIICYPVLDTQVVCGALMNAYEHLFKYGEANFDVNDGAKIIGVLRDAVGVPEMCEMELNRDRLLAAKAKK